MGFRGTGIVVGRVSNARWGTPIGSVTIQGWMGGRQVSSAITTAYGYYIMMMPSGIGQIKAIYYLCPTKAVNVRVDAGQASYVDFEIWCYV